MRVRIRRVALYASMPVALLAAAVALRAVTRDDAPSARATYAELVAKNYRVLTAAQSRTLVRYATRLHACLVRRGGSDVGEPVASPTRIAMSAHGSARAVLRLLMRCDPAVGPPPTEASLQARPNVILLYLPKRCLLDPAELEHAS